MSVPVTLFDVAVLSAVLVVVVLVAPWLLELPFFIRRTG